MIAALAGCSTGLEVRHLATGRADTEALELRGPDLDSLRREALLRCPQGAEILRQAARDQRPAGAAGEGRLARWMTQATAWVDPPQREAQLLMVCKPRPLGQWLTPPPQPADAATPSASMRLAEAQNAAAAAPPIGPITPEW